MDSLLDGLNPAQRAAVTSESKVLQVLAPPGSGKTKTLTARVAYQISRNGLNPSNIVVCTFTVKAAKEMQHRIQNFLGPELAGRLILGTFHGTARRLLAQHGKRIGLDQGFGIADAGDSKSIITRIIARKQLTIKPAIARNRISALKAHGISAQNHATKTAQARRHTTEADEITTIFLEYEAHLETSNLLDYDDLLLKCVELIRAYPASVANVEAVLIDEFQDTNDVQYDLMTLLGQTRQVITIVGDPDQSIYGWRSAKIENLERMQKAYPETHIINLEENYRSSSCILLAAQEVIEQDKARPQKLLAPTHSPGERPALRRLYSATTEGLWIVSEIQRAAALTGGLLRLDDFAVLLRSAALSRLIESALGKAGIPYRMVGGHRFFDRVEVKIVLDYLRVLDHLDHSDALLRILNVPSRQIGDESIRIMLDEANERRISLWRLLRGVTSGDIRCAREGRDISKSAMKGVECFVNLIIIWRKKLEKAPTASLPDFVESLTKKIELKKWLAKKYPGEKELDERLANVEELITQAAEASHSLNRDIRSKQDQNEEEEVAEPTVEEQLSHFLTNVALSTDAKDKKEREDSPQGHVTLSTMHAAKGLEWPVVFIPAAYEGSIPHSRAEDVDEERRLLYVAMTRAQSLLYISCPIKASGGNEVQLSHFLTPKAVAVCCADRGPSLTYNLVRELAKILGREKEPLDIKAGRATVERLEDDQYPQCRERSNGDEEDEGDLDIIDEDGDRMHSNGMKRRWTEDRDGDYALPMKRRDFTTDKTTFSISTTMNGISQHTIAKEVHTSGFVSARSIPQQIDANKENLAIYKKYADAEEKSRVPAVSSSRAKAGRGSKLDSGQQSLTSLWAAATVQPVATERPKIPSKPGISTTLTASATRPTASITTIARCDMTLESSDMATSSGGITLPAITRHQTSMELVKKQPLRGRVLGAKPSMNGWQARMNR